MIQIQQPTGTVKWFNRNKGYGFITPDDATLTDGEEIFVHYQAIADQEGYRNLYQGDHVRFTLVEVGKGPQAQNVHRLHAHHTASDLAAAPSPRSLSLSKGRG